MTDERWGLTGLTDGASDADSWREMIGTAAGRLMEAEVGSLTRK